MRMTHRTPQSRTLHKNTFGKEVLVEFDDSLLSYREVATLLGVKVGTLYCWVHRRHMPHVRLGKRVVRFRRDEIVAWLDANRVTAAATCAAGGAK